MEIRSLEIDFDRDILRINGKTMTEPVLAELPGPDGWVLKKIYNFQKSEHIGKKLEVTWKETPKDVSVV